MAANSVITPTRSSLLFLVLTLFVYSASTSPEKFKEIKMTFYVHDFVGGPNASVVNVAGIPGKSWSFSDFGTVYVTNDMLREGVSPNSPLVGRTQGIYAISSFHGVSHFWSASIVFTNKAYNGSTLEIQGRYGRNLPVSELSIVSGTGKFRFARGYATNKDISATVIDAFTIYTVSQFNITIRLNGK